MDIRKPLLTPHSVAAFTLAVALTFPCVVTAVGIGEATLQSKLGEPLHAQVDLMAGSGEQIDGSCLSLIASDPLEEDASGYITGAALSLKTEGMRQYVDISSSKPFNDAFARLRLQVKCVGTGAVIKTLTVLPDLESSVAQTPIAHPSVTIEFPSSSAPAANLNNIRKPQPDAELANKAALSRQKQRLSSAQTAGIKRNRSAPFGFQLSREPIDELRIGKISEEERVSLLMQQKLLNPDDLIAGFITMQTSFLAMQNQVKQLQDEIGAGKLQLKQLAASHAITEKQLAEQRQNNADLKKGLFATLGLLIIVVLWLGMRQYNKIKSHIGMKPKRKVEPILNADMVALSAAAPKASDKKIVPPVAAEPPGEVPTTITWSAPAQAASEANTSPPPQKVAGELSEIAWLFPAQAAGATSASPLPHKVEEELSEEDGILEEAELYANLGRPSTAVKLLQNMIKQNPAKVSAWKLLLSIYSSLAQAAEFEKTARKFLTLHQDSPSWGEMQALGRTLDPNNPLYVDNNGGVSAVPVLPDATNPRRPIGEILIEMKVLSAEHLLEHLDNYNPKTDGRFGSYLVKCKAITLAQLDQALLRQQGVQAA